MNRRELLLTIAAGAAGAAAAGLAPCKARGVIADPEPPDEREGPRAPAAPGPMLWPQTVDEFGRGATVPDPAYPPGDPRRYRGILMFS